MKMPQKNELIMNTNSTGMQSAALVIGLNVSAASTNIVLTNGYAPELYQDTRLLVNQMLCTEQCCFMEYLMILDAYYVSF